MRRYSLTSNRKGKNRGKVMGANKIVDFLKPSQQKPSLNLSSDVAPNGLDTNTHSIYRLLLW